jgi:membrane-associated phospholipid phosphatase
MATFTTMHGRMRFGRVDRDARPREALRPLPPGEMALEGPAYRPYARPKKRQRAMAAAKAAAASRVGREASLVVFAYFLYFAVRGFTEGSETRAVDHAHMIVNFEKSAGFFWEPSIQEQIVSHHWIVTAANWMYIWGHWPLIATVAAWLVVRRPAAYSLFRNAFFISGAIGIIIFVTFPVAPPRLADLGLADTVTQHSHAYRVLQPPAFVNQYAAVPSLHFGWDLLIGIALVREARWLPARIFGAIVPVLMACAIVLTANHYIFDVFAGGVVALTGLGLSYWLTRHSATAGADAEAPPAPANDRLPMAA